MRRHRLEGARVLLVDDDDALRQVIRDILEAEGATVIDARGLEEAVRLVAPGSFDLVISDVQMPGGGGPALFHQARALDQRLGSRFLFLTGDPHGPGASQATATGARLLTKPVEVEALVAAVALLRR